MKAIYTTGYGDVSCLEVRNLEDPVARGDRVLVEVHACSVNPVDWKIRKGEIKPSGKKTPPKVLGCDFSGVVTGTGANCSQFKKGDRVWGVLDPARGGAYAEYLLTGEGNIAHAPSNLNDVEAASIPLVGSTALQLLVNKAGAKSGQHVLVNGCSGGVGNAAVQIAKALGTVVTGVCGPQNVELARQLGCDYVIDYTADDFLAGAATYDVFLDAVGNRDYDTVRRCLKPSGAYVTTRVTFSSVLGMPLLNMFRKQKAYAVIVKPDNRDLDTLREFVETGMLKPLVAKIFPFDQVGDAHLLSEKGRVVGKIVLAIKEPLKES